MATSVILLAGGLGTRVRALYPGLPKPMIPSHGRPFLEWVLRYWGGQHATHCIVSLGHLADVAERYLDTRPADEIRVEKISEPRAMGTGGAVLYAARRASALSDPFFVANADSLVLADVSPALRRLDNPAVDGVVLGIEMDDTSRYGSLDIDPHGRLRGFLEKRPGHGWINAGVYLFRHSLLDRFPAGEPLSMETQVFPALLASGACLEVETVQAPFLDMGTPESLAQLDDFIARYLMV